MFKIKFEFHIHINKGEEGSKKEQQISCDQNFFDFAQQEIDRALNNQCFSTARNYGTAARSLKHFLGKDDLTVDEIDGNLMESYEKWLRRNEISLNTIACYMGSLRAIYNKAVEKELTTQKHPFRKVFTGTTKTEKRAISEQDINSIQALSLRAGSFSELARDIFLFCFYVLGMPFVDVAFLKKSQIKNGELTYHRHKTGQPIHVQIEPCMKRIMERHNNPDSPYVFPLLKEDEPEEMYKKYVQLLGRYNRALKSIAKKAKLKHHISSYVVRHSWASIAYQQNIELPIISKALGHTNSKTTLIYIRELNNRLLAAANRKILKKFTKRF